MSKHKNTFYKIFPYICGLSYGVFVGIGVMYVIEWALIWLGPFSEPMEHLNSFAIQTIILIVFQLLLSACFIVTLIFNIIICKKSKTRVFTIILECILPFLTALPCALLFDWFYWIVSNFIQNI